MEAEKLLDYADKDPATWSAADARFMMRKAAATIASLTSELDALKFDIAAMQANVIAEHNARINVEAELDSARGDAERLDWLDQQRGDDVRQVGHDDYELVAHYWSVQGQCADVRSAIDDAIAATPKVAMPSVDQETGSVTGCEP